MKSPKIAIATAVGMLSILQLLFAFYQYPLLGTDGSAFLTASINWANGDGFINNFFYISRLINVDYPEPAFTQYPPVFPALHAGFYYLTHNLYIGMAVTNIMVMCLFVILAYKARETKFSISNRTFTLFIIVFLIAWNTQLNPGEGRPEPVAEMWLLLLTINVLYNKHKLAAVVSGLLIGLIGFTHPIAGIYSALLVVCYLFYSGFTLSSVVKYIVGGMLSLAVVGLIFPYDLTRLAGGIVHAGSFVINRGLTTFSSFIFYHFTSPVYTFFFFVFILGTIGAICFILRHYKNIVFKLGFFLTLFVFAITCLYFSFQTMEVAYNLYVLFPLFGLGALYLLSIIRTPATRTIVLLLVFAASAGFIRRVILFYAHIDQGVSFAAAKHQLERYPLSSQKTYATISMFNVVRKPAFLTDDPSDTVQYKLIQQNSSGLLQPEDIPRYQMIQNTFIARPVKIAGLTIATSPPGYQFALYKRISP